MDAISIGKYKISQYPDMKDGIKRIWIEHEDGEASSFGSDDFEKILDEIWKDF